MNEVSRTPPRVVRAARGESRDPDRSLGCRVEPVPGPPEDARRVDGDGIDGLRTRDGARGRARRPDRTAHHGAGIEAGAWPQQPPSRPATNATATLRRNPTTSLYHCRHAVANGHGPRQASEG